MEIVVVDSATIISLSMNGMLEIFRKLKNGKIRFVISKTVYDEVFRNPLNSVKFKFAAMNVEEYVKDGILEIEYDEEIEETSNKILELANSVFNINGNNLNIIHRGEAEIFALAKKLKARAVLNDERVSRQLLEAPEDLLENLSMRFHKRIRFDSEKHKELMKLIGFQHVLRSVELVAVAFDKGLFDEKINKLKSEVPNARKEYLEGMLWALKFSGCFITQREIDEYVQMLA